jgi:hypothetical protein
MDEDKHTSFSITSGAKEMCGSVVEGFAGRCSSDVACRSGNPTHLMDIPDVNMIIRSLHENKHETWMTAT